MKRSEKYRRLSDISSTNARFALKRVDRTSVMAHHIGTEQGQIKPAVIEWLEREELVAFTTNRKGKPVYRTTELGKRLVRQHVPKYLSRSGVPPYTTSVSMSLLDAGEVMDLPNAA